MAADTRLSSALSYTSVNQKEEEKKTKPQKTKEINGMKQKQVQDILLASEVAGWGL